MKAPHLISAETLLENLRDYTIVEIAYDPSSYKEWHLPRAVLLHWWNFRHPVVRDFADRETLGRNLGKVGISREDRLVLYSDFGNRYAYYALWLLLSYGHKEVYVLDGGKVAWEVKGLPMETESFRLPESRYDPDPPDWSNRITVWEILTRLRTGDLPQLIDARYREEFEGKLSTPPEHPHEEAQTRGHIPGAINVPWNSFLDDDTEELRPPEEILSHLKEKGIRNEETVVYCRTGARASLVWYYLKYVLGFKRVRLYDGSWSEWGNMVGMPVEF